MSSQPFTLNPSLSFSDVIATQYTLSAKIHNLTEFMACHLEDASKDTVKIENLTWLAQTIKDLQTQQDQCFYWIAKNADKGVKS